MASKPSSSSPTSRPQFWIDVGGTFTDCLALFSDGSDGSDDGSGEGTRRRLKVLSSGVVKGSLPADATNPATTVDAREVRDPARSEPEGFWVGWTLAIPGPDGEVRDRAVVRASRPGCLTLDRDLPTRGTIYELSCGEQAPLVAVRRMLELPLDRPIPPIDVRLGTTRGTNALLTRDGARTALATTAGFADLLEIGTQNRPRLFDLAVRKRDLLHETTLEIAGRLDADGVEIEPLDEAATRRGLEDLRARGVRSLAICLMHAWRNPDHEERVAAWARDAGFEEISRSSKVARLIRIVSRGDTTVIDAYLNPVLRTYVERLREAFGPDVDLRLLTSAGGLVGPDQFTGKDSILSGPAGGVVGFARTSQAAGFEQAIGFDMGGTSTDVARFAGRFEREYETEKAGVRVVAPMMAIETVAAGGGSICDFDGVKLTVGPASAGADPGPACYGRGGPLTVTDVNLELGRLLPDHFPFRLDRDATRARLDALVARIRDASGKEYGREELAAGFLQIANAGMARAIRSITTARGCDPREHVLVAFGGAAPQHACAVARELGMRSVLVHPEAGILSAYGIGLADVARHRTQGIYRPLDEATPAEIAEIFRDLEARARAGVEAEGVSAAPIETRLELDLRYQGLDAFLTLDRPVGEEAEDLQTWAARYHAEHRRLFGYTQEQRAIELVAARVQASGRAVHRPPNAERLPPTAAAAPRRTTILHDGESARDARVDARADLRPGQFLEGPAVLTEEISTIVVDAGWRAEILSDGQVLLEIADNRLPAEEEAAARRTSQETDADPVRLELFNHAFAGIAEQMGITLRKTSSSVNVKERLDFSCAIFTAAGDLVVNAPHVPVHLGAMGETVRRVLRDHPDLAPGDVVLTNDPYRGGSHLPDLTVVTPVFDAAENLLFFTASRAHHAEIGGVTPGSMPPFSKNLGEEGVLIRNFRLIDRGRERFEALRRLLTSGPYPSRSPDENLADVAAQVAANRQGADDLLALIERSGRDVVLSYMRHIQEAAERKMRDALARLDDGEHAFEDVLDDGSVIRAAITIRGDEATIDFHGTSGVLDGNLNANRAIVSAAVLYVLRCLIDEDLPLNQGVLTPVEIVLPECLLNPPEHADPKRCAAVVGGNVETSQRVTDVLLGALRLAAASQGTMNNLLFGDENFGYYETICGGAGATRDHDGASAVHTHMTNTRLTDPEVLEQRFPVRLRRFAVRRGSGGAGRQRGGDGIVREIEFLKPLKVSLLSQRRAEAPPYGMDGGEPGAPGRNTLVRVDGERRDLGGCAEVRAEAGDVLIVETPGGGGWGAPGA